MTTPPGVSPERTARALALLSRLLHDPSLTRVPLEDLARDLGLSRAEILEDARLLNLVNFGGGTYLLYLEQEGDDLLVDREPLGDNLQYPARLSPTLARSLMLALELVGDVVVPGSAATLLQKLNAALASAIAAGPAPVGAGRLLKPSEQVLGILGTAVRERRMVRIEYFSAHRGEVTLRNVEPHILCDAGTAWYLEAYCLRAEEPRTFRVDLIKSAETLDQHFLPREEMSATPLRADRPPEGPLWARLAVDRDREAKLRSDSIAYTHREDGRLGVETPYFDTAWLVGQVLGGLGATELLEPGEIRAHIVREGRALLAAYS